MIRIRLKPDDLARIRIAGTPDFTAELASAGQVLAAPGHSARLSPWRRDMARHWRPDLGKLLDLYAPACMPATLDPVLRSGPGQRRCAIHTNTDCLCIAQYTRHLSTVRELTPFTRGLADFHDSAYDALDRAAAEFRGLALDPYRHRITAMIAAAAAAASSTENSKGTGAMLGTLHPTVSWDGDVLRLETDAAMDVDLDGFPLVLHPVALTDQIGLAMFGSGPLVLRYPAAVGPVVRDPQRPTPDPALTALLSANRAAVLTAIVATPAVTTGQLAANLGISAAAASRHASILRASGLVTTVRAGMTVHHRPTRLGTDLAGPPVTT